MIAIGPGPLFPPAFSSFRPGEVKWLLADYSALSLERPASIREVDIQSGRAHYAEDLPIEVMPTMRHTDLFDRAMRRNAALIAACVSTLAGRIAAEVADSSVVVVSLARAGVPPGIWVSYELSKAWGKQVDHYAVSIVRDRGIDMRAMAWIAAHHDPANVIFVDGWTGKGTIRRELTQSLAELDRLGIRIPDRLAVVADPAHVADMAGTTDDILVPTACLNSTSCGLVSRTVLRQAVAPRHSYHGARLYPEFAASDRSRDVVDCVTAKLGGARRGVATGDVRDRPRGFGSDVARTVAERLGIVRLNLAKPGIGETTRVLQRRVPEVIFVHPDYRGHGDLEHVHQLADDRGSPIRYEDTHPYRCVGVVRWMGQA